MSSKNQKRQRLITFIFVNTIQYSRTLTINIYHSNKWGPPLFLHLDTSFVIGHALVHSVDKTHVLVVTVDLIWLLFLNILSFFQLCCSTEKISQVHKIHKKLCKPPCYCSNKPLPFCLMCAVPRRCSAPFFCSCLFLMILHLRCSKVVNSKVGRETNRCQIVINISNLIVGVKHSIRCRTTFSPNLHSVEEETLECLPILQH